MYRRPVDALPEESRNMAAFGNLGELVGIGLSLTFP